MNRNMKNWNVTKILFKEPINDESFTNSVKKSILKKERNRSAKKV